MTAMHSKVGLTANVKPSKKPPVATKKYDVPIVVVVVLLVVLSGYIITNLHPVTGEVPKEIRYPPTDGSTPQVSGYETFVLNITDRIYAGNTTLFVFENKMPSFDWWGLDPLCGMTVNGTGDYGTNVTVREGMNGKILTFADSFPSKVNRTSIQFFNSPLVVSGSRGWWEWKGERRDEQSFGMCTVLDDWKNNTWSPSIGMSLTTFNGTVVFTTAHITILYIIPTAIPEFGSSIGIAFGAVVIGVVALVLLRRRDTG